MKVSYIWCAKAKQDEAASNFSLLGLINKLSDHILRNRLNVSDNKK